MSEALNQTQYSINSPLLRRRNKTFLAVNIEISPKLKNENYQNIIMSTFAKLNTLMPFLDTLIQKRLTAQQAQMVEVMKGEIQKMKSEINRIVYHYNQMIRQKNRDEVLFQTRNQLQFYKTEGLKLHTQNIQLRNQIQKLKNIVKQNKIQIENGSETLKKVTRKYIKLKSRVKEDTNKIDTFGDLNIGIKKRIKTHEDAFQTYDYWLTGKNRRSKATTNLKRYQQTIDNRSFNSKYFQHSSKKRKSQILITKH